MRIEPSGVIFVGICDIQTDRCMAKQPAALSAVWTTPARRQVNVCSPCLEEKVRLGEWEIQGARIHRRADVAAYSPDRKLQLVVEVASNTVEPASARNQALKIHRNLLAHSGIPPAPYFLLYLHPGHFYLWMNSHAQEPAYAIDDENLLKPYLNPAVSPDSSLSYQLESAVARWLEDVAHAKQPLAHWLVESGLDDVLRNSSIAMQSALAA